MITRLAFLAVTLFLFAPRVSADAKPSKPAGAPQSLMVYPAKIQLSNARDQQRVIVVGVWPNGVKWDLTQEAKYSLANANPAQVDTHGIVSPRSEGTTSLSIVALGVSATVPVEVVKVKAELPVNFSTEIVPILTKFGCNAGNCHGVSQGRGGFRLSLFGFDATFDYEQIVRSNEGRRIVVSDPERSILLAKPALIMEHGGGEKLKHSSREYARVRQWLEDGAPAPNPKDDAHVTKLELFPKSRLMVPGETQQLAVTAIWSDGRREDVTPIVQFDALNDSIAAVNSTGFVTAKSAGETHVMIRFHGQAEVVGITLPFASPSKDLKLLANNFIDEKLISKWKDLGLAPSPLASDAEFLRRLSLDAIGTLPTPEEIRKFLTDPSANKRKQAIDTILNRPEFVDWWALKWADLLRVDRQALQEKGMWSFHNWIRAQIRDGKPVDEFVRDVVTAEGSTFTDGPANFFQVGRTADDWSENTTQVFLGIRVQCAKCHHHPFEKWTQDDYYGMAAFFSRLGTKNSQEFGLFGRETVIFLRPTGDARHPRKGTVVKPHPFDGPEMEDEFDRRKKLADWMTSPENRMFSRNIVNRFWGYLMGRGLVEPLDDLRSTNPASNPELLDLLADDFVKAKFDLKHLLRTIFNSRAYQLSSQVAEANAADSANIHFTRYTIKRLTAEQVADGVDFATGTREKYLGVPLGTRAIQLPDTSYRSYLMDTFGRPARQLTCECERTTKPNIAQALHLLNGDFLNKKIADRTGRVEKLATEKGVYAAKAIEELYLATFSRPPSEAELAKAIGWVKGAPNLKEGLQDLLWVLINSREFLFNH